jgi:hypothetical protein
VTSDDAQEALMDSSDRDQVERRLASARRNALDVELTLARQRAITAHADRSPHDAEVAKRVLASLQAVQRAAERDFRDLLAHGEVQAQFGDDQAAALTRQASKPDASA